MYLYTSMYLLNLLPAFLCRHRSAMSSGALCSSLSAFPAIYQMFRPPNSKASVLNVGTLIKIFSESIQNTKQFFLKSNAIKTMKYKLECSQVEMRCLRDSYGLIFEQGCINHDIHKKQLILEVEQKSHRQGNFPFSLSLSSCQPSAEASFTLYFLRIS